MTSSGETAAGDDRPPSAERERPQRVLVCFHEPHLGGATRSVERIVPRLSRMGWQFSFWVPRPSELYDEFVSRGWDVEGERRSIEYSLRAWRLPPGAIWRLTHTSRYVRRFAAFLTDRRPQLVHANSILTLAEALIAKRRGHAVLLHAHEMLRGNLRGRLLRRTAWKHLDQVIAVSQASAAALAHRGRLPRIVYEAAPVPEKRTRIRSDPRPFRVGTVAVISTRKGSDLFVEAARLLRGRRAADEFSFEMVGAPSDAIDRDWASEVLERATRVGIEHRPQANVFERFGSWDAFVLPSRADPFPIAMLEAMASGLPVVGARRDGIAEQVLPGCGLLVDPDDPRALADAIAWLAGQRGQVREQLALAARERVALNFTLDHQAAAMDAAYRATLESAARRAPSRRDRAGHL